MIRASDVKQGLTLAIAKIGSFNVAPLSFNGFVSFNGATAYAVWSNDGRAVHATVNFPAISDEARLSRAEADRLTGYLIHELGHVSFTDLDVFKQQAAISPFRKMLLNGLEDPRIETAVLRSGQAPGGRHCLTALVQSLLTSKVDASDIRQAPFIIAVLGRAVLWGLPLPAGTFRIPPHLAPFYRIAMDGLRGAPLDRSGTAYLATVVDRLVDWLKQNQTTGPQPQPQPQPQDGEPGEGEGQPGEGEGEGEGDDAKQGGGKAQGDDAEGDAEGEGEPGDGDAGDASDPVEQQTDDDAGRGGEGAGGTVDPDSIPEGEIRDVEPDSAVERLAEKAGRSKPLDYALDRYEGGIMVDEWKQARPSPAEFDAVTQTFGPKIGQLSNLLGRALVSPERSGWDTQRPSGRFDVRRAGRAMAGAESVFKQRWERPGLTTDVALLIDQSGSMTRRNRSRHAGQCAVALAGALDRLLGVSFGVFGFGATDGRANQELGEGLRGKASQGTRYRFGAQIQVAKPFDQPLTPQIKSAVAASGQAWGGTPDAPSIKFLADVLRRREASRRVLIVLTDGDGDDGVSATYRAVQYAERCGVEVIGIGLDIDLSRVYPTSINVANPSELTGRAMQLLVAKLATRTAA